MILHKSIKQDLVLITHGSEKGVFENDGGLFLKLIEGSLDSINGSDQFVSISSVRDFHSLLFQIVHFIRQHSFQSKQGTLFSRKGGTFVESGWEGDVRYQ